MTDLIERPTTSTPDEGGPSSVDHGHHDDHGEHHGPSGILKWLTSTDHKVIGINYTVTSIVMMVIGGAFACVFLTYGIALRQRLLAYRDTVMEARTELERRRASGQQVQQQPRACRAVGAAAALAKRRGRSAAAGASAPCIATPAALAAAWSQPWALCDDVGWECA